MKFDQTAPGPPNKLYQWLRIDANSEDVGLDIKVELDPIMPEREDSLIYNVMLIITLHPTKGIQVTGYNLHNDDEWRAYRYAAGLS